MSGEDVAVLIPAAGTGARMDAGANKVLLELDGEPMIRHTVRVFQNHPAINRIVLIINENDREAMEKCFQEAQNTGKLVSLVAGGAERQDSVWRGIEALSPAPPKWVLIHDGARPLCPGELIDSVLAALENAESVVPVVPIPDTVRRITRNTSDLVDRSDLYRTQTPQGFHWEPLYEGYLEARGKKRKATDDARLLELNGVATHYVTGFERNFKITHPEEMVMASRLISIKD